ncbi:MAG: hypothetical protein HY532_00995 [Chloroflexi bacterium]|nr:hypothetical protein [Chloroflexota bacterium]
MNSEVVWATIQEDLPELLPMLQALLAAEEGRQA